MQIYETNPMSGFRSAPSMKMCPAPELSFWMNASGLTTRRRLPDLPHDPEPNFRKK